MVDFELQRNTNGFTWGPLQVICEASHKNAGVYLALETRHERVDVRVTPKGFIRLGTVQPSNKSRPLPASHEMTPEADPWELLRELYEASLFVAPKFGKSNLMNATRKVNAALKQHDAERTSE